MINKKIFIFVLFLAICLWIMISEIKSYNKEYTEDEKNTKIHSRSALFYAIVGVIAFLYLIFIEVKNLI